MASRSGSDRIYLDNAATSWPKPVGVYDAVDQFQRDLGAPASRSHSQDAEIVAQVLRRTRRSVAELIGAKDVNQVVFTFNGTDSLNLAIIGLLGQGDHVITSDAEHNSVLRPLRQLEDQKLIEVSRVSCGQCGTIDVDGIATAIRPTTRMICIQHASNVTGAIQPVESVSEMCKQQGIVFLVDAAQTMGHLGVDVEHLGIDLLASSGHKGLLGPLGTGLLYVAPHLTEQLTPIRFGGTGTESEVDRQPTSSPDRFESGNANVPGLFGLEQGVAYVRDRGIDSIRSHELDLARQLVEGLHGIPNVVVYGPKDWSFRSGVVSMRLMDQDPRETSLLLDQAFAIQTRAGFHCAPRIHKHMGTSETGGTLRFSPGAFNTPEDIEKAIEAVRDLVESAI